MAQHQTSRDVFPHTASTWLVYQLTEEGHEGLDAARQHIMSVYFEPLMVYVKGSSFRRMGEAEDLVSGFFADRLNKPKFLTDWMESGRPLRRWLIVGLKFHLLERARSERRHDAGALPEEPPDTSETPGSAYNRAIGLQLLKEAMRRAADSLAEGDMAQHWEVFLLHHVEGMGFDTIGNAKGVTPERASVMSRTAMRRFRRSLRDVAAWPGASDEQIDHELKMLFVDNGN